MKYIKTFEEIEELPKSINIDSELDQLRKLDKEKDNMNDAEVASKKYDLILDKEDEIEKQIKAKLDPILNKYLDNFDYEGAKWFVGRSYGNMNTCGKTLLFRKILMIEYENTGKYNL